MSSCPGCANLSAKTYIIILSYPPTPVEEGGARKGVPSLRGQTHVAGMRVARSGLRGQDERDKWKQTGSFWTRLRLGKAVAGSGVRSQTLHKK